MANREFVKLLGMFGPGIVFVAAAVGVSHLVQATRAGAQYGLWMLVIVVLACIVKYPVIRLGTEYAGLTGQPLISSYRRRGKAAFLLYAASQLATMVFVIAAIAMFCLGLLQTTFGFDVSRLTGVAILLALTSTFLLLGGYGAMEKLSKLVVSVFALLVLVAVVISLYSFEPATTAQFASSITLDKTTFMFIIALVGFMPTPADASVIQSLWIKEKSQKQKTDLSQLRLDFNTGYVISLVLGLCFVFLGFSTLHANEIPIETSNFGFARQFVTVFTQFIGPWSFHLVAITALLIMISTLYTVLDGMSRVAAEIIGGSGKNGLSSKLYPFVVIALSIMACLTVGLFLTSFTVFMDMTSVMVFCVTPLLAWLNHKAVFVDNASHSSKPGTNLELASNISIWILTATSLGYLVVRFVL